MSSLLFLNFGIGSHFASALCSPPRGSEEVNPFLLVKTEAIGSIQVKGQKSFLSLVDGDSIAESITIHNERIGNVTWSYKPNNTGVLVSFSYEEGKTYTTSVGFNPKGISTKVTYTSTCDGKQPLSFSEKQTAFDDSTGIGVSVYMFTYYEETEGQDKPHRRWDGTLITIYSEENEFSIQLSTKRSNW